MDLYHELGLEPDASPEEIKAAYRAHAKRHHPDNGGDAEAFARANTAWMVLRDPARRAKYDRDGTADTEPDNPLGMQMAMLNDLLEQALAEASQRFGFEIENVVKIMVTKAQERIANLEREIARGEQAVAKYDKLIGRVKYDGKGTNLLARILRDRQTQMRDTLAQLGKSLAAFEAVSAMLDDYDWIVDEMFADPPRGYGAGAGERPPRMFRLYDQS